MNFRRPNRDKVTAPTLHYGSEILGKPRMVSLPHRTAACERTHLFIYAEICSNLFKTGLNNAQAKLPINIVSFITFSPAPQQPKATCYCIIFRLVDMVGFFHQLESGCWEFFCVLDLQALPASKNPVFAKTHIEQYTGNY